ncbi:MAG: GNAT family N-acetyltransferase [Acidobacteria bacterium]|nr:GNAT family N-acetyltransferase [Acidobacteriota bacterium]
MSEFILETPRLRLREITDANVEELFAIWGDAATLLYFPQPIDRAGMRDWMARNQTRYEQHGFGLWAVIRKADEQFVGDCGLTIQDVDGVAELEVGYHFNQHYWGQGYATEAARACMDYAFQQLGRERIISLIRPENMPSRRIAERNGMTVEKETIRVGLRHLVYRLEK